LLAFSCAAAGQGKSVGVAKNISISIRNSTGVHNLAFIYELSRRSLRDLSALLEFSSSGRRRLWVSRLDQLDIYGFMQKFVCSQAGSVWPGPTQAKGFDSWPMNEQLQAGEDIQYGSWQP